MKTQTIVFGLILVLSSFGLWRANAGTACEGPVFSYINGAGNLATVHWAPTTTNFTTARCAINTSNNASCGPAAWTWSPGSLSVNLQGSGTGASPSCDWSCRCIKSGITSTFAITLTGADGLPVELLELSID